MRQSSNTNIVSGQAASEQHPSGETHGLSTGKQKRKNLRTGLLSGIPATILLLRAAQALRANSPDRAVKLGMLATFWLGIAAIQWPAPTDTGAPSAKR